MKTKDLKLALQHCKITSKCDRTVWNTAGKQKYQRVNHLQQQRNKKVHQGWQKKTPPNTFFTGPSLLTKARNLTCISHTPGSLGFKAISLVSSQSLCFNLQQPSEPLIHLPKMTVTDSSAKQSIYFLLLRRGCTKHHGESVSGNSSTWVK